MADGRIHIGSKKEDAKRTTPWESLFFAYAAMAPLAAGAVAFFLLRADAASAAARLMILWAGSILCFLPGVRRGLSFRQEGGPLLTQLATMIFLFALGVASLVSPSTQISLALQILGYTTVAVLDPLAARWGEAPRYFEGLRPLQMAIPIVSLGVVLIGHLI